MNARNRFDHAELEVYCPATERMLGMRLSQLSLTYKLRASDMLDVLIHRKELPVSTNFGNAKFVFVFLVKPTRELVVTAPFTVSSKQLARKPYRPPKRIRGPPSRQPAVAPPCGDELYISTALQKASASASASAASTPVSTSAAASAPTMSPPPCCLDLLSDDLALLQSDIPVPWLEDM